MDGSCEVDTCIIAASTWACVLTTMKRNTWRNFRGIHSFSFSFFFFGFPLLLPSSPYALPQLTLTFNPRRMRTGRKGKASQWTTSMQKKKKKATVFPLSPFPFVCPAFRTANVYIKEPHKKVLLNSLTPWHPFHTCIATIFCTAQRFVKQACTVNFASRTKKKKKRKTAAPFSSLSTTMLQKKLIPVGWMK